MRRKIMNPMDHPALHLHQTDFSIIGETPDWIVLDKPAHLLVYPSKPGGPVTLLDELEQLLVYELATGGQISIINRLDRETSGIVLVAKTREAARVLGKAMDRKQFQKSYHAVAHGWPENDGFEVDAPILRMGEVATSPIYIRRTIHPAGKASLTRFRVLKRFLRGGGKFSLLECQPVTGRTHQIRVHLEHAGYSIVGDKIYGHSGDAYLEFIETGWTSRLAGQLFLDRHALHAAELVWKNERWRAPLPVELVRFINDSVL